MPRLSLTEEERLARRREQKIRYRRKNKAKLNKQSRDWLKANPGRAKITMINRVRHHFPEGAEISHRQAVTVYRNTQKGSLIVRSDKLQNLMEDQILPCLPNATYRWETDSELIGSHIVATHTLTYSDDKIEWEVVTTGLIGVRDRKLHLILGPDSKVVANCVASPAAGSDRDMLASLFIRLVLSSVGLPHQSDLDTQTDLVAPNPI